jgi:hypothetical protein
VSKLRQHVVAAFHHFKQALVTLKEHKQVCFYVYVQFLGHQRDGLAYFSSNGGSQVVDIDDQWVNHLDKELEVRLLIELMCHYYPLEHLDLLKSLVPLLIYYKKKI